MVRNAKKAKEKVLPDNKEKLNAKQKKPILGRADDSALS